MSERNRLSLYQLSDTDRGLIDQHGDIFNAEQYSRFKYGDQSAARSYGYGLSELVREKQGELLRDGNKLVVTAVPFRNIPIGANAVADAFYDGLNYELSLEGRKSAERAKMTRSAIPEGDYGSLSEEERQKIMQAEKLHIDADVVAGSHLFIVDDIVITGKSAETVASYVDSLDTLSVWYLYVAQMHEEQAKMNPQIEAQINHAYVNDLSTLAEIVAMKDFILNQRVVKFMLSYENTAEVKRFFSDMDDTFLRSLFTGIVNDELVAKPSYQDVVSVLKEELQIREIVQGGLKA